MSDLSYEANFSKKFHLQAVIVLFFLLISRLVAMYFVPLMDSTEARYGEIAREMLKTNNWITLFLDYGKPFLAKPPLSTWLSAFSMRLFGINELTVRLPSLLLSIGILWLVWDLAKKRSGSVVATLSVLLLAGSLYFFLDAGAVMTDPSLVFCITLSMVAFWHGMIAYSKIWAYVFFIGLGLGLLAKGPIAIVLTALPIFTWLLLHKQWKVFFLQMPWLKGCLIILALALPWYILAEMQNPGFINYFIVGENISRFYIPGWKGNHYGFCHLHPFGAIWGYTLFGLLPWSIVAIYWLIYHGKKLPALLNKDDKGWISYLLLWLFLPLLFFTFSRNIIYTYVFPSLPAFALLFAELLHRSEITVRSAYRIVHLAIVTGLCFLIATALLILQPGNIPKTTKPVIAAWKKQNPLPGSKLIYWGVRVAYSAEFYSAGSAIFVNDFNKLQSILTKHPSSYLVINSNQLSSIPVDILVRLTKVDTVFIKNHKLLLFRISSGLSQQNLINKPWPNLP
jgi:4-amino-4-deoxy-L-arabinose transferase-like glycosyltransferase